MEDVNLGEVGLFCWFAVRDAEEEWWKEDVGLGAVERGGRPQAGQVRCGVW